MPSPAVLGSGMLLAKGPCAVSPAYALVVIAQCLAQDLLGVLAQQWRRRWINRRRQAHIERRFDIGDHACSRMRNLAETMPFACFGRVEPLLHGSQIANRDVGLLHLGHPVLELVAGKDPRNNGAQLLLVLRSYPA